MTELVMDRFRKKKWENQKKIKCEQCGKTLNRSAFRKDHKTICRDCNDGGENE